MALRIYTDEDVPGAIVAGLRRRGVDARSARDVGNLGFADEEHLTYATREKLVLFTHDDDYLRIASEWRSGGKDHTGIIFAPQTRYGIGECIYRLMDYATILDPEDMRNCVEFL